MGVWLEAIIRLHAHLLDDCNEINGFLFSANASATHIMPFQLAFLFPLFKLPFQPLLSITRFSITPRRGLGSINETITVT
jgi:hypothetical protein